MKSLKSVSKRMLTVLLALVMCFALLSISAFAAGISVDSAAIGLDESVIEDIGSSKAIGGLIDSGDLGEIGSGLVKPGTGEDLGDIEIGGKLPGIGVEPIGPGAVKPVTKKITVTYYANFPDGTTKTMTQTGANNVTSVVLEFPDYNCDGYDLVRWTTSKTTSGNNSDKAYQNGDTYESTSYAGLTLYARWEKAVSESDAVALVEANGVSRVYDTLQGALDAVYNGNYYERITDWKVTLQKDVKECVTMKALMGLTYNTPISLTLDLNGHILSGDGSGSVISVAKYGSGANKADFIIADSVGTGVVTGGNAFNGGAIDVSGDSKTTLYINGGNFINNTAENGGAISANKQSNVPVIINGGKFSGNTATNKGGAIYARDVTVNDGTFTNNTADMGGAFYVVGTGWTADLAINSAEISGNTATTYGDDIVFGLTGNYNRATTLKLPTLDEGMAWVVDGYNLTAESDRAGFNGTTFTSAEWPKTGTTGKALIALKAGCPHTESHCENIKSGTSHNRICDACEYTEAVEHVYDEWVPVGTAPHTESAKCAECGYKTTRDRACQWDDGVVTVEATCGADGEMLYTCTIEGCDKTKTEVIPAAGAHTPEKTVVKVASCTEAGETKVTCSECGNTLGIEKFNALGHTEEVVPETPATCTESGLTAGVKCSVCGEVLEGLEEIPALGGDHEFGEWKQLGTDPDNCYAHCEKCGYMAIQAHEWTYTDNGDGTHTGACDNCGATTEPTGHTEDAGTTVGYITTYACTECGVTLRTVDNTPYIPPVITPSNPNPETPSNPENPENPGEDISDEQPPLSEQPTDPGEDITDEQPPLAEEPTDPGEDIEDEQPPLADVPKTGDSTTFWMAMAAVTAFGLLGLAFTGKRKEDEEA